MSTLTIAMLIRPFFMLALLTLTGLIALLVARRMPDSKLKRLLLTRIGGSDRR
jgi:hypothetical protein